MNKFRFLILVSILCGLMVLPKRTIAQWSKQEFDMQSLSELDVEKKKQITNILNQDLKRAKTTAWMGIGFSVSGLIIYRLAKEMKTVTQEDFYNKQAPLILVGVGLIPIGVIATIIAGRRWDVTQRRLNELNKTLANKNVLLFPDIWHQDNQYLIGAQLRLRF